MKLQWQYVSGGEKADAYVAIAVTGSNRLCLAGYTESSGIGLPEALGMQDGRLVSLTADLVNDLNEAEPMQTCNVFPNPVSRAGVIYLSSRIGEIFTDACMLSS